MNKKIKTLLSSLDRTRSKFWNIPKETGLFLNKLIRNSNIKTILEIGTSNGVSAIWMAEALKAKAEKNGQKKSESASSKTHYLYTIESHFKLRFPLAKENFKKAGLTPYITQILGHAPEVIPKKPKYFDLIFLDATKYEHVDYLKTILPRTRFNTRTHFGSVIITDNALSHKKELAPYFKAIKKLKNFETHLIKIGSGLLISVKISD